MSDLPENVYHYSDASGAVGIIESMVLWASDWRHLSDPNEFSYPREVLARVVDRMRSTTTSEDARFILDDIATPLVHAPSGDLQSQWTLYADNGTGFAIGLSRVALIEAAGQRFYSLGPLIYSVPAQEAHYEALTAAIDDLVPQYRCTVGSLLELALLFSLGIVIVMTLVKNPAFSDELEWRLMRQQLVAGDSPNRKVRPPGIPYEDFPIEGPITDVVAGPSATEESVDEVRRVLDRKGLGHIRVRRSALPL
jgi:hypothetical protein